MNQNISPTISIVLGAYNRGAFLNKTLESVRNNGMTFPYEIFVVDGGSTDGSLEYLLRQKDVTTIIQHNRGNFRGKPIERHSWGYFMNLGFKCAHGKYILMISDDCLLIPGAVENGVRLFEKLLSDGRKVGAAAFYWRDWPESQQYWVGTIGERIFVNHGLFLREALEEVHWIDEETYQFYHADGDLCLRLWQKGYEVVDSPDSFVEHFAHANLSVRKSNSDFQRADWEAFKSHWQEVLEGRLDASAITHFYKDPYHTYLKFPRSARFLLIVRKTYQATRKSLQRELSKVIGKHD
jgi:glycosyltransferase involved in cell wall biosynthesis